MRFLLWATVGSVVVGFAPVAHAQRAPRTAGDRCAELLKAARDARSLADLRDRIERSRPSETVLERCAEAFRRDPRVADLLERERRQLRSRAVRPTQVQRARAASSSIRFRMNRHVLEARREARSRLRVLEGRRPVPRRSSERKPNIGRVTPSPVVPGTDLVIEGAGFGDGGSVRLALQGRTFDATVNDWTETWISAYLSEDVSGVTETSGAVVEVEPEDAASLSTTVPFVPIYESAQLNDMADPLHPWPLPGERDETFADGWSLENGWRLSAEPWTQSAGEIECEIAGPPVAEPGDADLATRVHVEWGWFELPACFVYFEIEGPKGLEHGFENPLY